jgi:hypothetical protein
MAAHMSGLRRGLLAGAAGTTALNAATYLDMAVRGRPPSETPRRSIETITDRLHLGIAGRGAQRDHRLEGLSALAGIATGVSIGGVFGWLHAHRVRFGPFGSVVIGGSAMLATDASMVRLGISDPRDWTTADWLSDALPHLAYGIATQASLTATQRPGTARSARPVTIGRAVLAGLATGGRASSGLAALALARPRHTSGAATGRRQATMAVMALFAGTEAVLDKQSTTPPRTEPVGLLSRAAAAVTVGAGLARRTEEDPVLPAAVAALAALAGAATGVWWRTVRADALGLGPLQAALIEDAVVVALAATAAFRA